MYGAIKKLFVAACAFAAGSLACFYAGAQRAAGVAPALNPDDLSRQFTTDPGEGLVLAGGFLLVVALALASAGLMLWRQERS
ncbi:MAG TPA: hypothetical protein VF240_02040 [Pyrinomonadaceae bacterium]